ncbi:MAG TPA: hypothetical protein PLV25_02955, partial [Opitutales bacterium]|nr:hypothetical protein [Opitutales bacterium]
MSRLEACNIGISVLDNHQVLAIVTMLGLLFPEMGQPFVDETVLENGLAELVLRFRCCYEAESRSDIRQSILRSYQRVRSILVDPSLMEDPRRRAILLARATLLCVWQIFHYQVQEPLRDPSVRIVDDYYDRYQRYLLNVRFAPWPLVHDIYTVLD